MTSLDVMEQAREARAQLEAEVRKSVEERVERGIQWMHEHHRGWSWLDFIDPVELEITSGQQCVLGQRYKAKGEQAGYTGYNWAEEHFQEIGWNPAAYGFMMEFGEGDSNYRRERGKIDEQILNEVWKRRLGELKAGRKARQERRQAGA